MNRSGGRDALPLSSELKIDAVCDAFERELRAGRSPRIEDYLRGWQGAAKSNLVEQLVQLELEYQQRIGGRISPEELANRLPDCTAAIERAIGKSVGTKVDFPPADTRTSAPGATSTAHVDVKPPDTLARYEILEEVARGGMGVVYRARHKSLEMAVAIKILLPGQSSDRFLREAKLLASIRSPHVVVVYDYDVLPDGRSMICMEWIEGSDLRSVIGSSDKLTESQALVWMLESATGMRDVSNLGIVHRDVKPSNILIRATGTACVADFGLARREWELNDLSRTGLVMGTPYYMAPEQAEDPQGVDTRADIYSFGATFYHALTGRVPFDGTSAFNVLFKHKTEPLISPQSLNRDLSDRVSQILERCLCKSPRDRFQSFSELISHLDEASDSVALWDDCGDTALQPYLQRYYQRREDYLNSNFDEDCYEFSDGRVLKIIRGDIVEQCVDAIVSSDDSHLSMGGGVSCCLSIAAGPELLQEAQAFAPARPGRVIVTRAGQLRARFVFHAITLGVHDKDVLLPSRDLIAEILKNCFYHADTVHVQTMAIPQIGAGVGGFPKGMCLDMIFRFVARTLLHNLTGVREVRIIFLDDRMGALRWWAAMAKRRGQELTPAQHEALESLTPTQTWNVDNPVK